MRESLSSSENSQRWVLVIRLSSMGDIVHTTSVLQPLKEAGFQIAFLTKKEFAPLLQGHSMISEILPFEKNFGEKAFLHKLLDWMTVHRPIFVLDLHDSWRTFSWRGRMKSLAPVFVAKKERLREWLILFFRLGHWFGFGRGGRARKYRERARVALLNFGCSLDFSKMPLTTLEVTDEELAQARQRAPASYLVVLPGSAWVGKCWPYFAPLIQRMREKISVVVLGGKQDLDFGSGLHPVIDLLGKTSLRESMALIANARAVVGNDTGMVHVAEALGVPNLTIEGPTHPYLGFSTHNQKENTESKIISKDYLCRPCSKSGRFCVRAGSHACLTRLSPENVQKELEIWLC